MVLRAAHAAARDDDVAGVREADRRLNPVTLPAEFRESATRSGARLLSLQRDLRSDSLLDAYADAVDDGAAPPGRAGRRHRTGRRRGAAGVSGVLPRLPDGAARRLLPAGHTAAQRTLDDLRPTVLAAVDDSAERTIDGMTSFTPLVDVLSAEHERADRRLFPR